ncbi:hypothetical protein [Massilia genomosp. 1]|uniref:hypothetical protein n=1 Tax=Massilia genomosp. 1 TaxID=2609280 RepID=UPI00141DC77C|nr:hypothetical protein [Massilia genomosp. 1]
MNKGNELQVLAMHSRARWKSGASKRAMLGMAACEVGAGRGVGMFGRAAAPP